jgi:hypothetical protein
MTTTSPATDRTAALEEIDVANNVRSVDVEHALAGSICLQGIVVPVVVRRPRGTSRAGGSSSSCGGTNPLTRSASAPLAADTASQDLAGAEELYLRDHARG